MTDRSKWEHKTLPIGNLEIKEDDGSSEFGTFGGYASVFNKVDSYGDTIFPGAYKDTIPHFLKEGFIAWSHFWDTPIATLKSAEEDHHGLYINAEFHSTDDAQRARKVAVERLDRGKTMGLSIGFLPKEVEWPEDTDDWYRGLKKIELFETSLVMVPADKHAQMDEAKSIYKSGEYVAVCGDVNDFIPESLRRIHVVEGNKSYFVISGRLKGSNSLEKMAYRYPHSEWTEQEARTHSSGVNADFEQPRVKPLKIADHLDRVLGEVTEVSTRVAHLQELRVKEGRTISEATRERLTTIVENLEKALGTTKSLLEAPTIQGNDDSGDTAGKAVDRQLLLKAQMTLADVAVKLAS